MAPQFFSLVMRAGPNPGKAFELTKGEMYIGRDVSNDIVISDAEVSRKHARLVLQAGGYVLEDLQSTNGTFANGQRLMGPHVLRPGELIMLGENVSLSFEAHADESATLISAPPAYPPPARQRMPSQRPVAPPTYAGQVPPAPEEPYYEYEPPQKKSNTWLWVGCGCLVVLLCAIVGGALAFDYLQLYCTPPFDAIFYCP
jgi:hypothetical protein